jgi:hypothetical protein
LAEAINRSTCWRFTFKWDWKTREVDKQQCLMTLASWFAAHDDKCEKRDDWNGLTIWVWSKAAATQLRMMANQYSPAMKKTTRPNFHVLPDKPFQFEMNDIYTIPYTVEVSERTAERATAKFWELWRTDSYPRSPRPAGMPENAKMFSYVGDGKPKPSEEAPKTK